MPLSKIKIGFAVTAAVCLLFLLLGVLQVIPLSGKNFLLFTGCFLFYTFGCLFLKKMSLIEFKRRSFGKRKSAYDLDVALTTRTLNDLLAKGKATLIRNYYSVQEDDRVSITRTVRVFGDECPLSHTYLVPREFYFRIKRLVDREEKVFQNLKKEKEKLGI